MPGETFLRGVVKIHQHCGGVVRFVEVLNRPGVEFTGECRYCDVTNIAVEDCFHIYEDDLPDDLTKQDVVAAAPSDLKDLRWRETWRSYEDAREDGFVEDVVDAIT